jgi:LPXTG-site transpeptidase (sortase) family protein
MKKLITTVCSLCLLVSALAVSASAADYSFSTTPQTGYYKSTNYEDKYDAQYNYKGTNQIDYDIPAVRYGLSNGATQAEFPSGSVSSGTGTQMDASYPEVDAGETVIPISYLPAVTVEQLKQNDGSLGTVSIGRVGLSAKVFEGATTEAMAKGAGHYSGTSVWNGNVGLFGHNRGSHAYFAALKNVKAGDTVTYKTSMGTRTYRVTFAGTISWTDFSYLNDSGDNRITLITCVANQPTLRVCVQAVEVK